MRATRALGALGLAVAMLAGGAAFADSASCDIPVIHALPGGAANPQLDPAIGTLRPYLTRPPFTAWHEFKLLDRKTLQVAQGGSQSFTLPNKRQATLAFLGHVPGQGEHRLRLRLTIDHTERKHRALDTTFVLDEGGVVLHVGQQHQGGVLILAVSCKTRD